MFAIALPGRGRRAPALPNVTERAEVTDTRGRCLSARGCLRLGTQIVRTLIQGELGGTIDWHTITGSGTEVTLDIPLRYIARVRA